jgi:membrane protein DedA with SNARE-associated domain
MRVINNAMFHFIDLTDPQVLVYIKTIGYPTMFALMVLEGPIITILGAFLASLGFFNIFLVFFLSVLGDIVGDMLLYSLGFYGGPKILSRAEKILHIGPETLAKLENLFIQHGKKTVFSVKSTTGLCWITFIAAGTFKMRFRDFLFASFGGGIIWSTFLVVMGFFFGFAFEKINLYLKYAGLLIFLFAVSAYLIILFYKKRQTAKILAQENNHV